MEFIDNEGPNTLRSTLLHLFQNASTAEVHVAFATEEGVALLLRKLRRVEEVRVLVGLWQGFTDPKALRVLLDVQIGGVVVFKPE
ncbi:MAG: hypothetical protein QM784_11665 [Polyangiaceae bacterium]